MHTRSFASFLLAMAVPVGARADTTSDLQALREEIRTLRAAYEARLQALEQRLQAAEAATPRAGGAATPAPAVPAGGATAAAGAAVPAEASAATPAAPYAATASAHPNAFNPALSLILSGLYARTSQDPAAYAITGFLRAPDAEIGPGTRGFGLAESELVLSASVDPWWRGMAAIAVQPDDRVSVEEAYAQTTALGHGLSVKAGRFFSAIGYQNAQHAHAWDFVDAPLAYQAMLGTQFGDDGVQLTWLAPTERYLELGAEVGRGRAFPGDDGARNGAGMRALALHTGGDVGDSHSWRAGVSALRTRADGQALRGDGVAGNAVVGAFSGRTTVWIADGVWKWAPEGNASRTSFKLQGEVLRSTRRGTLTVEPGGIDSTDRLRAAQSGWTVQGVYQFVPRWRAGLRVERLDPGRPDFGLNAPFFADTGYRPQKATLMLDYSASEFSRLRLQLASDRAREGAPDRQIFLQYQMSLGAHGAHGF